MTGALNVGLSGGAHVESGASKNPEAYNSCLQAQYFSHVRSKEGLEKAVAYYEQATRLDPGYALAWVMLGSVRRLSCGQTGCCTCAGAGSEFGLGACRDGMDLAYL